MGKSECMFDMWKESRRLLKGETVGNLDRES